MHPPQEHSNIESCGHYRARPERMLLTSSICWSLERTCCDPWIPSRRVDRCYPPQVEAKSRFLGVSLCVHRQAVQEACHRPADACLQGQGRWPPNRQALTHRPDQRDRVVTKGAWMDSHRSPYDHPYLRHLRHQGRPASAPFRNLRRTSDFEKSKTI